MFIFQRTVYQKDCIHTDQLDCVYLSVSIYFCLYWFVNFFHLSRPVFCLFCFLYSVSVFVHFSSSLPLSLSFSPSLQPPPFPPHSFPTNTRVITVFVFYIVYVFISYLTDSLPLMPLHFLGRHKRFTSLGVVRNILSNVLSLILLISHESNVYLLSQ